MLDSFSDLFILNDVIKCEHIILSRDEVATLFVMPKTYVISAYV